MYECPLGFVGSTRDSVSVLLTAVSILELRVLDRIKAAQDEMREIARVGTGDRYNIVKPIVFPYVI